MLSKDWHNYSNIIALLCSVVMLLCITLCIGPQNNIQPDTRFLLSCNYGCVQNEHFSF